MVHGVGRGQDTRAMVSAPSHCNLNGNLKVLGTLSRENIASFVRELFILSIFSKEDKSSNARSKAEFILQQTLTGLH
jgi:hypothetical protein